MLAPWRKAMTNLGSVLKSRDITWLTKVHIVKAIVCSSHVQMWELDHKEGWEPKNWCFQIVVLENTCESSLDCKIKPVKPKRNQPWIFLGKTNSEAETPIVWSPDVKSQLIGKDPDAGKDWREEEKVGSRGWDVGWHHWLSGHEFEQTPGDNEGHWSLKSSPAMSVSFSGTEAIVAHTGL